MATNYSKLGEYIGFRLSKGDQARMWDISGLLAASPFASSTIRSARFVSLNSCSLL